MTELVVEPREIDTLIVHLRSQGRTVLGPTIRDGAIVHDVITGVSDLPRGWTEEQDGGSYRLVSTGTDELFAFSAPSMSWKRFVFPPKTLLIRGRRGPAGVVVEEAEIDATPMAFFGVRSCDLAALAKLDQVFLDPAATDPYFAARRHDIFVVAAACGRPGNTCFCASMDTGPSPSVGYDLAIRELPTEHGCAYLITAGTERGDQVLAILQGRAATETDRDLAAHQHHRAVSAMGRSLDPADPVRAALDPEHPRWTEVAERCLACGNCTMVCPTCFCSTTVDSTSLDGLETDRSRVWDSCFTLDFTHLHGGSVRTSTTSRYRQWLLHKLVTWHDQFGSSGCVGCGRCITWCPVGIDLTAEIAALAQAQAQTQGGPP